MKRVYRVEHDKQVTPEGFSCDNRVLGEQYDEEVATSEFNQLLKFDPEKKRIVNSIIEEYIYGKKVITVYYSNGDEEEITDINRVFRGVINE